MTVLQVKPKTVSGQLSVAESTAPLVEEPDNRGNWGNKVEFILTCVGYAVGLGNVWRFPYLCYRNGGGAFLVPYFIMLALVGLPVFYLEVAFGQFASRGPLNIWSISPVFKGLGYAMVIVSTCIGVYYNVIVAWCVYYFFSSMTSRLPWETCDNYWNTEKCISTAVASNRTLLNQTLAANNLTHNDIKASTEEYFYNRVLNLSDGLEALGDIQWELALCLLLAWVIVFLVLIKGIQSLGKVVYFTSIFPYVLLTVMLIRGVTLDGAVDGLLFYLKPDFSRLADARVWSDAAVQIFYSLGVCTGGIIAMASYNKFDNNCLRDSIIIPLINCGTSFFAGFVIFSVLGYMAHVKEVSVADVAASGPGLVFVVYPEGLSTMPVSPVWAVLFFFMMTLLGFSSQFSIMENFFASFADKFPTAFRSTRKRNILFRLGFCLLFYGITLTMVTRGGFYLVNLVDSYVGGFPLIIIGIMETVIIQYVYGYEHFAEDIKLMLGKKPNFFFQWTWKLVSPFLLLGVTVFKAWQYRPLTLFDDYRYPGLAGVIAWSLVGLPLVFVPVLGLVVCCQRGGFKVLRDSARATPAWGPARQEHRTGQYHDVTKNGHVNQAFVKTAV